MTFDVCVPINKDQLEINDLFVQTISDLFLKEEIFHTHQEDLVSEIELQNRVLQQFLDQDPNLKLFFIAKLGARIVGTLAAGLPNEMIKRHLKTDPTIPEIKCVYILPTLQNKGVGSLLLSTALNVLSEQGIQSFYLDCGYSSSQQYWLYQLGDPIITLQDYWGPNKHHMIWQTFISQK